MGEDSKHDAVPTASRRRPWLGRALGLLAAAGFMLAMVFLIRKFIGGEAPRKPTAQQVAILRQPPPLPPKPPERPPEPPKVKEEVKIDQPKPEPQAPEPKPAEAPPADKPIGLDADGAAGSDGFGLAANRGGRDVTTIGGGSGGGGTGRYYTGLLQRNFFEALARNRKAPLDEFSVVVRVWLADDGRVQRTQIVNGSGNPQLDELITATLAEMPALREVPPGNLRQVQLRLNRRA